jgi:hypothetical protein
LALSWHRAGKGGILESQTFAGWLFGEAGAGWFVAFLTLAGAAISYYRRNRPNRVVVREVHRTSLVRIRSDVRERIAVTFEGMPVQNLGELEVEILNDGSSVISPSQLTFVFPPKSEILVVSAYIGLDGVDPGIEFKKNEATVSLPYLNPVREHNQRVRVSFAIDGALGRLFVRGSGAGWSIRHLPLLSPADVRRQLVLIAMASFALMLAIPFSSWWLYRAFGITTSQSSWRTVVATLPVYLLVALFGNFVWQAISIFRRVR